MFSSPKVVKRVIEDIASKPVDYNAQNLDGFQINRCGTDILRLQRIDEKGNPCTEGRVGFLEYNAMRAVAMDRLEKVSREELLALLKFPRWMSWMFWK